MIKTAFFASAVAALLITAADAVVIYGINHNAPALVQAGFFGSWLFPFLLLGYGALYRLLFSERPRWATALFISGAYLAALSTLIQGSTGLLEYARLRAATVDPAAGPLLVEVFSRFKMPLYAAGALLTIIESLCFVGAVWTHSAVPRRVALINRLFLVGACLLTAPLIPSIKVYLQLLSPNLSHLLFFSLLFLQTKKSVCARINECGSNP